jgi:aerobic-type carbon monoxide dehydrogenase small subunit (CoxS/CutS family)
MILAVSRRPVGLYVNGAELTVWVTPGENLSSVFDALQPFRSVKSSEYRGRIVPVVVSVTNRAMKSKDKGPVLFTWNSTHEPVPGQLSIPL